MVKAMDGKGNKKKGADKTAPREEGQDEEADTERGQMAGAEKRQYWWPKMKMWMERYVMFVLPFVTVLREGVEAIVFVAGVSFAAPASSIPIPAIVGIIVGVLIGVILYQ